MRNIWGLDPRFGSACKVSESDQKVKLKMTEEMALVPVTVDGSRSESGSPRPIVVTEDGLDP